MEFPPQSSSALLGGKLCGQGEGRGLAEGQGLARVVGPVWRGGTFLEGRGLAGGEGPGWRGGVWLEREVPVRASGPVLQEMASGLPTAAASAVDLCPLLTWGLLTT